MIDHMVCAGTKDESSTAFCCDFVSSPYAELYAGRHSMAREKEHHTSAKGDAQQDATAARADSVASRTWYAGFSRRAASVTAVAAKHFDPMRLCELFVDVVTCDSGRQTIACGRERTGHTVSSMKVHLCSVCAVRYNVAGYNGLTRQQCTDHQRS